MDFMTESLTHCRHKNVTTASAGAGVRVQGEIVLAIARALVREGLPVRLELRLIAEARAPRPHLGARLAAVEAGRLVGRDEAGSVGRQGAVRQGAGGDQAADERRRLLDGDAGSQAP